MENPTYSFGEANLVLQLINEFQIKSKTVRSWSSQKKKDGSLFYLRGILFNICVLFQCIMYWIHFQDIYIFTYQKTFHTLLFFVFKINESLQCIIKLYTGITISWSFTLSIRLLLILLVQSVNGVQFFNITFLFVLFTSAVVVKVLTTVIVPSTSMYASLQSQKLELNIAVSNLIWLLVFWVPHDSFISNQFFVLNLDG